MKKFVSMLAGVVMASSLFAVSAYAAGNVSISVDKTEVNVGEQVVVTIDSAAKSIAVDGFNVDYDEAVFKCVDILDDAGYSVNGEGDDAIYLAIQYKSGRNYVDAVYSCSTIADAAREGKAAFYITNGSEMALSEKAGFAQVVLEAIAPADTSSIVLNEDSAGTNGYKGVCASADVTVKAPVEDDEPTWKPAADDWTAPEGKKAIWWGFDFAAGEFGGHQFITVTDGAEVPTTKTVGVGAVDGYDIDGAVSFAVAVILDEDVDAANFDAYVGK